MKRPAEIQDASAKKQKTASKPVHKQIKQTYKQKSTSQPAHKHTQQNDKQKTTPKPSSKQNDKQNDKQKPDPLRYLSALVQKKEWDKAITLVLANQDQFLYKHHASRIIQQLIKFTGTNAELRTKLLSGIKDYGKVALSAYGKFIVIKALKYATPEMRSLIVRSVLKVGVAKLMKNKEASMVVDCIYTTYANGKDRREMVSEFYGVEYQFEKKARGDLTIAEAIKESNRKRVLTQFRDNLKGVMKDSVVGKQELFHRVVEDYMSLLSFEETKKEFIDADSDFNQLQKQIPEILHTKYGASVAMRLIACSGAKDRKVIIKSLKPFLEKIACNEFGWLVLCKLVECVDDTVLLRGMVLDVLKKPHAEDKNFCKFLLFLLGGRNTKYFSPDLLSLLSAGQDFLKYTSKKDEQTRRKELMTDEVFNLVKSILLDNFDEFIDYSKIFVAYELLKETPSDGFTSDLAEKLHDHLDNQVVQKFLKKAIQSELDLKEFASSLLVNLPQEKSEGLNHLISVIDEKYKQQ